MATTTIQVVVEAKLKKELKSQAEAEKRPLSNYVGILIEEALLARKSKEQVA